MHQGRFLAGAALLRDQKPIDGPAARRHPMGLLAILAAHHTAEVGRDKLIDLLWPARDSRAARHLLSEALYALRKTLGREAIRASGDLLTLNADLVETDVGAFRRAVERGDHRTATELYRGPFLDGFHLGGSREFEAWRYERQAFMAAQYEESLYVLADRAEAGGDHREAVRWLRLRCTQDPFSSHATHRLMLALARTGDRAAAVMAARAHRRLLEQELGIAPAPCVRDLEEALAGTDPVDLDAIPRCGTPGSGCAPETTSYQRHSFAASDP